MIYQLHIFSYTLYLPQFSIRLIGKDRDDEAIFRIMKVGYDLLSLLIIIMYCFSPLRTLNYFDKEETDFLVSVLSLRSTYVRNYKVHTILYATCWYQCNHNQGSRARYQNL